MRFLPINLHDPTPHFPLAAIDDELFEDLLACAWRTKPDGTVYRRFQDTDATREINRAVIRTERLQDRLSGSLQLALRNNDPLDLRGANFLIGHADWGSPTQPYDVVPKIPGFLDALRDRKARLAEYRLWQRPKSQGSASLQVVRKFLEDVRDDSFLRQCYVVDLVQEYYTRTGRLLSAARMADILRGKALTVPGFNYVELAAARPDRSAVARRREEQRRFNRENP